MADTNVTANAGAGGSKFKVDDDLTQVWPYTKLAWGPSGTQNELDDAAGKRIPVKLAEVGSVTVPISAAALPLPTGAALDATLTSQQVADNAAFTDGTTKLSMQGYIYDEVAGTALTENDAAAARVNVNRAQVHTIEDGATRGRYATVSAANALKIDGSAVTQPVSGTFWQATQPVSIATAPVLVAGSAVIGKVGIDQTTPGTTNLVALAANQSVNVAQINGVAPTMGNGASGTGVQRVTIASDSTGVLGAVPLTAGGASIFHLVSAATTNLTNVKNSAGQLYGWSIANTNTAANRYVKLHNTAGTPTAGTAVGYTITIPAGGVSNIDLATGLAFSTGIGISTVTGAADSDTTAVAANDLIINLHYK